MNNQEALKNATTLAERVAVYKLIARDSLRMDLISPRLSKISGYEDNLKQIAENKAELELDIKVETYEISKLDTEHPLYAKRKENKEKVLENLNKGLESIAKEVEDTNKLIAEQKESITKIEKGETKVSAEALANLVATMVEQDAKNQVPCGTC